MAGEVGRVDCFFKYLNEFLANIRPDDPLPVRAPSYKVTENEIDGQILDIVHHYLNGKDCPVFVRSYVAHKVWEDMRQPALHSSGARSDGGSDGFSGEEDEDSDDDNTDGDVVDAPVNNTYEAMKLIKEVTNKANDVIRDMTRTFTPEKVAKTPHYLPVSSFAIKNSRRKMEDRHIILRDLNTLYDMEYGQPHAFYGVFDGHAGSDAAVYTAAHLHQYLIQNPLYHMDPVAALKHAFHFADTNFIKKAKKERLKGGTTAVVALHREKRLLVAWLGDSLAVLVRKRMPVKLVEPHKPDLPSERDRVNNLGGCVVKLDGSWRIMGQLAVSRAIGDAEYKPFISSECDIKVVEVMGDEDFLILATDGLWDTITYEEAVSFVYAYLTINQGDCEGVGRCLVDQARRQGSQDNITAVVIFLRPVEVLMEEEAARREAGQISEAEMDPSWLMKKDAAPSTIYEIFSNNVGTFNPDSPSSKQTGDYNPFSPDTSAAGAAPNLENGGVNNGKAAPTHCFGSYGQASGEEFDLSVGLPVSNTPDPTMEDVESALAELDSLPDGDNERDDDADRWRAEEEVLQQKQPEEYLDEEQHYNYNRQSPLSSPTAFTVNTESLGAAAVETSSEHRNGAGSGTSSPRSVEGFITSVELNTAQEQLLADATAAVEAPSGPYSVYVSSSPEPASLDPLVEVTSAPAVSHSPEDRDVSPVVMDTHSEVQPAAVEESVGRVEIVHAQSTVEVVSPPSPTHEPELVFSSQPAEPEPVPTPSPVYTHAPLNEMMAGDLMSTSMILEQPISDAPEQVQEMMQFMTSSNDIVYNSLEQQQTAEFVHITSESERRFSPQMDAANLMDTDDGEDSYHAYSATQPQPCSPIREEAAYNPTHSTHSPVMPEHEAAVSPVASPLSDADDSLIEQMNRANLNDSYPAERAMSPEQVAAASPSPVPSAPVSDVVPSTPVKQPVIDDKPVSPINTPKQDMPVHDEDIVSQIAAPAMDLDEVMQDTEPLHEVEDFVTHEDVVEERLLSPVHMEHTPVSDVVPSTPIKEPLINDRPISPINTPKSAMTLHDDDIISKIDPPALEKEAKKAPVKPAPRTTPAVASRSRPLSAAAATKTATPTTTNVKPGTPRPSARTAPGSAVRSTATTTKTATPATRTTPTTTGRTPLSSRITPVSRSNSATSTSATRTTTTARTPMSSRTATPSATRTTPSSSATRTTPSAAASRPTPTTRTTRPSTTPTPTTARTTMAARTPSSRPTSAATTPTTARRAPISRRTPTATTPSTAKDVTDSSKTAAGATTKPSTTARVPLTRKPLYPGPKTTATTTSSAAKAAPSDKKEIKNTTNKLLSTRTSTLTRTTASTAAKSSVTAPTHKPLASKTAAAPKRVGTTGSTTLKSRTTTTTTKTVSKSKTGVDNATEIITTTTEEKKEVSSPETNGEVKIAQEEISVEVESKEETEHHFNGDAAEPVEVMLVNGDH